MSGREAVPRGRHAPPLEVRQDRQRRRLFTAAASVFARLGYAEASAEAIAKEAGMSKATFYEHFDNKEECMIELFRAVADAVRTGMLAAADQAGADPIIRLRSSIRSFFEMLHAYPDQARTLLVEVIGAGPNATRLRDDVLAQFATIIWEANARGAEQHDTPRLTSWHDAFLIVGAIAELASRQLRVGEPSDIRELEPVVERLILGLLGASERRAG